jgi:hypothetical protein
MDESVSTCSESVKQPEINPIKNLTEKRCGDTVRAEPTKECKENMKQPKTEKPQKGEHTTVSPTKLPDAGSQRRKRDPSSESLDH